MTHWRPRTASDIRSDEATTRSMDWVEAQPWCNFALLEPTMLPGDVAISSATMRPEAPPGRPDSIDESTLPSWTRSNRSVHRCVAHGDHRRVRIKQFLYDYAPPAFDHPCLWESPVVEPFAVGTDIGWCGTDYLDRPGATVTRHGTTVEFSVLDGRFRIEEFQAMCEGLVPVGTESAARIADTPLAELSYQRRHDEPAIAVPVGYLAHKRPESSPVAALTPEELPDVLLDWLPSPPSSIGFRLDSAFLFGDRDHPDEVDFVLVHERDPGWCARVLVSPRSCAVGVPFPPTREERQPCHVRELELGGRMVTHAFAEVSYGQHEAVWQAAESNVMLIVKPQKWTSADWFVEFLEPLILSRP